MKILVFEFKSIASHSEDAIRPTKKSKNDFWGKGNGRKKKSQFTLRGVQSTTDNHVSVSRDVKFKLNSIFIGITHKESAKMFTLNDKFFEHVNTPKAYIQLNSRQIELCA